ncbi:PREDICTED: neuron-specific vesicular protein calcyon isoform X3 [Hipposideros armiger]|uniref:Neuron-specific vesicular protein calcyon isoform X3 n=1 Tax=Hipposideros armiger TaxID=186990 RepID=A0A8B7RFR7_HIPAR|nr:PREDICTED: neuron-specific vesicular protein calcyon isoform X3 [Hipposideros armiger]
MGPQAGAASVWGSAPPPPRPGCGCEASGTATFLRILVWGTSSCRSCPLEPPASGTIGGLRGESRCLDFQTGRGVQSYTDLTCCPDPLSSAELGRLGGVTRTPDARWTLVRAWERSLHRGSPDPLRHRSPQRVWSS